MKKKCLTKLNSKQVTSFLIGLFLILSVMPVFSPVISVNAGVVERQKTLESLIFAETRIYTGNQGSIGMEDAAHPSILYRLIDAKINNDNSLIGSIEVLVNELTTLEQSMNSLLSEDDDYILINEESLAATGYTFLERVSILIDKMIIVVGLIPECGINNIEQQQAVLDTSNELLLNLNEIKSFFIVVFPDPALDTAIRAAISKPTGDIYLSEVLTITELIAGNKGIVDLSGIEYCYNLQYLELWYNQIVDISSLSGLTNLETLDLQGNQIVDISSLSGLTTLWGLDLKHNQIVDISSLSGLTNLQFLTLMENLIVDITPLSELTSLLHLYLGNNLIVDITPLSELTNLGILVLYINQIVDITPLSELTNIVALDISHNLVVDISPLSVMINLQGLILWNNQIEDISPLLDCLDNGDSVDVRNNPLDSNAPDVIAELEMQGVEVFF